MNYPKTQRRRLAGAKVQVGKSWGLIHPDRWQALAQLDPAGVFLDVGCARGSYVERLRAMGRTAWGTDLLLYTTWVSRPHCFQSDAPYLPIVSHSVDYLFAFEVLEHISQPLSVLREFKRVTRQNLILPVPNCEVPSALRRAGLTFHHYVDPTHTNFSTSQSLHQAVTAAGFRVESVRLINPVLPELLTFAAWRMPNQLASRLARLLQQVPGRCQFYLTILLAASA